MPARYRIDTSLGVVFSNFEGVVTMEETLDHHHALEADPDFRSDLLHFSDARKATRAVASEDVRRLAKMNPFRADTRRAIIVSDDAIFGVSRMYQAQVEGEGTLQVFRDVTDALAWLGLPEDTDPDPQPAAPSTD